MKITDLKEKLIEEGCNKYRFGVMCIVDDAYNILHENGYWVIFYSERGKNSPPVFISKNESDACDYFFELITKEKHRHLIGFCKSKSDAEMIECQLIEIGVKPIRNDIPAYTKKNDPRYRVFVEGKDVFKVEEHFGRIILKYD